MAATFSAFRSRAGPTSPGDARAKDRFGPRQLSGLGSSNQYSPAIAGSSSSHDIGSAFSSAGPSTKGWPTRLLRRDCERIIDVDGRSCSRDAMTRRRCCTVTSGAAITCAIPTASPMIIDPAVYYGCREAEFGMLRLFGSCPGRVLRCLPRNVSPARRLATSRERLCSVSSAEPLEPVRQRISRPMPVAGGGDSSPVEPDRFAA